MKNLYNKLVKFIKDNAIELLWIFLLLTIIRVNNLNANLNKLIDNLNANTKIHNENIEFQDKLNYAILREIKKIKESEE